MVGSIATQSFDVREVASTSQTLINQQPLPLLPQQSFVNLELVIMLHLDLVQTPQIVGFV